jgi:helix-turn-helix protein
MTAAELAELLREHGYHLSAFGDATDVNGAAAFLYMSRRTLEELIEEGRGPARLRVSARWYYPLRDLLEYRAANMVKESGNLREPPQSTQIPVASAGRRREDRDAK